MPAAVPSDMPPSTGVPAANPVAAAAARRDLADDIQTANNGGQLLWIQFHRTDKFIRPGETRGIEEEGKRPV